MWRDLAAMPRRTVLAALAATLLAPLGLPVAAQATEEAPRLVIEVAGQAQGEVVIRLRPDLAPLHVARLTELAEAGAYDGVVFHRVIEGFMAQTGDVAHGVRGGSTMAQVGTGRSDLPNLPAEFSAEPFVRGTVGMARSADPNSANSQFFIMFAQGSFLNGQYTVLGEVVSGMEVVDRITRGAGQQGMVRNPDWMERVRVER